MTRFVLAFVLAGCGEGVDSNSADLSTGVTVLASGQDTPCAVAVDVSFVYWANCSESGAIRRVSKFGGLAQTLAENLALPQALAVDGTRVYWVEQGNGAGNYANGGVFTVAKAGGGSILLAVDSGQPHTLAIDATTVYWASAEAVLAVAKRGGVPHRIAAASSVTSLAVDDTTVFWGEDHYIVGAILRAPRTGGDRTQISDYLPIALGVDAARLYFLTGGGDVFALAKTGGTPTALFRSDGGGGWQLALDGTYLYWTTIDEVRRIAKVGGLRTTLAGGRQQPRGIAVDSYSVYFGTVGGGTIERVSKWLGF